MQFTGRNLEMVYEGLGLAIAELHNQIATCPDVNHYAEAIDEIGEEAGQFEKLRARVARSLAKEAM